MSPAPSLSVRFLGFLGNLDDTWMTKTGGLVSFLPWLSDVKPTFADSRVLLRNQRVFLVVRVSYVALLSNAAVDIYLMYKHNLIY